MYLYLFVYVFVFVSQMAGGWINEVTAAEDTAICLIFVFVYAFVFVIHIALFLKIYNNPFI